MRIRKSFEQAICILLLIGTSEGPLKSHELSKMLDVSDSYLKKVTRQLVVAGLITSKASKLGGFILNKKMNDISFLDIFEAIEGKDVLIVEDIIDSGRTLYYLMDILAKRNPKSMKLCTLLDKPERRVKDVKVDYVGFEIPDEFVVGYGLDYDQHYRNLPYVGVIESE